MVRIGTESWRNSIHIAIRLQVRCVLRAAGFASNERENVQNRRDTAKVASHSPEPIFHPGVSVHQDFNVIADAPQPVNFQ